MHPLIVAGANTKERSIHMSKAIKKDDSSIKHSSMIPLCIVAVVAIVALSICFLSLNGFNSQLSVSNEKIEVTTENSNSNFSNTIE